DLVVVCYGLNDSGQGIARAEAYGSALKEIFLQLKKTDSQVIFMTPNMKNTYVSPLIESPYFQEVALSTAENQNNGTMDAYMECARKVCREMNIPLCDVYSKWKALHHIGVDTTV